MNLDIVFAPHLPVWLIVMLGVAGASYVGISLIAKAPGVWWRALALGATLLALANPAILQEDRQAQPDIAIIVLDQSQSQSIGTRKDDAQKAADALKAALKTSPDLEVRTVTAGDEAARSEAGGTALFRPMAEALADVPQDRIAGAILITDGQVHDGPPPGKAAYPYPVHALLTGAPDEKDRKLSIEQAPRYGIVGEPLTFTVKVNDYGTPPSAEPVQANLEVRIDGLVVMRQAARVGENTPLELRLPHGGENVIEIEVERGKDELTLLNNRAAVVTTGVRDRLKVLLVSGEPHAGERTWRNLLKADPGVSLVHFTILRPPEKQDGTPIDQLSLIAFPTRELFDEKLGDFNLIIFDRYQRRGLLPVQYYENVARYVEEGGALLVSAGSELASPLSIYRSPIASVLPAEPTETVVDKPFRPRLTSDGLRHPVTAGLPGANTADGEATWGRWARLVRSNVLKGQTVMNGADGLPLLVLDRVGKGRVALMLSDHAWLWTRGFEGGGPQAELLRRLAHWLMKEPDLEEERLSAEVRGDRLMISRRTMEEQAPIIDVITPSGQTQTVTLAPSQPGQYTGVLKAAEMGLYRLRDGELTAVAAAGPLNPKEFADVRATDTVLKPIAESTTAGVRWLKDGLPEIRRPRPGRDMSGDGWIGLRRNEQYAVKSVSQTPLFHPLLAVVLIVGSVFAAWRQEGR